MNYREYGALEADRLGMMLGLVGLFLFFLIVTNAIQKGMNHEQSRTLCVNHTICSAF